MAASFDNVVFTPDVFPPFVVESEDSVAWQDCADVIVVGFGGAGASAALEFHERVPQADVLMIDRFDGGGATAYSGGIYYAGATRHQREASYEDSAEEMYKYLKLEVGDAVSDETLLRFCESSNDNLMWIEKHGVRFSAAVCEEKTSYPPEDKFLYYSGNEKVAKYKLHAKPAPRGHRTMAKGFSGYAFFAALRQAVARSGIRLMPHAPVRRLVVDGAGKVVGVEVNVVPAAQQAKHQSFYERFGALRPFQNTKAERAVADAQILENTIRERRLIRARRGVVLATGGFIYNVPMLKQYVNPNVADNYQALVRVGSAGCSGAGIRLGMSVGGATGKMENIVVGRTISPPNALLEGIMVNQQGRRFVNEDTYLGFLGDAISRQSEGKAWLVLDTAAFWKTIRQALPDGKGNFVMLKLPTLINVLFGGTRRAATLEALAQKCGIDAAGLRGEVSDYNALNGGADPFGKGADYVRALGAGPYYALNMSIANPFAICVSLTLGGLRVNENSGAVLRADGSEIEGLYAAGRAAVGVCSNGYFSGMALADCVFSGRRAGAGLAAQCRHSS